MERPPPRPDVDELAAEGAGMLSWSKKERAHFNGHILFYESRRARILEQEEVLHI